MGAIMLVLNSLFCLQLIISLSDIHMEHHTASGVVLSLASAFFYAAYLVFLRRKVDHEDKMDIPLFFGRQTLLFKNPYKSIILKKRSSNNLFY